MSSPSIPRSALRDPVIFLATGFGSGLMRPAPGTWGTIAAVPFVFIFGLLPLQVAVAVVAVAALIGIWLCGEACERLGVEDHGGIVWDEMVGLWVTLVWFRFDALTVLLGVVLFRIFDIAKPWPISWADETLHGGFGVMFDDLIAGICAGLVLWALVSLLPV